MTPAAPNPRATVRRMVAALERRFGEPAVRRDLDLIGSFILTSLSQHTSDLNAERAYAELIRRFPTWDALAQAPTRQIVAAIRSAGLANQKGPRIRALVRWVHEQFGDYDLSALHAMTDREIVETMTQVNGIGIKTVSVVMLFSMGRDVFPVDTHVHRICRRVGVVPDRATVEQTHHRMAALVPRGKSMSLHVNLLRLGRTLCSARRPQCPECPLHKFCAYALAAGSSVIN
jgi:endonuclease III